MKTFFHKISGEDYQIIKQCDKKVQNSFTVIGVIVSLVFLLCFSSAFIFFDNIFNNFFAALVGLLWGFMLVNIYVLLLYTITPAILKSKAANKKIAFQNNNINNVFSLSFYYRIGYVLFIAYLVAIPIRISCIEWMYDDKTLSYIEKVKFMNTISPMSNLIVLIVISLFAFPIYLKYKVRSKSAYYDTKKSVEMLIVKDEYAQFKSTYKYIFSKKYNILVEFYEKYQDAPFNMEEFPQKPSCSQSELLIKIYGDD